ncbi:hypothetical protein Tco_1461362, partial [Tanacetum coccineum]
IENVIIVPTVLADEFELKTKLLDFVSNNSFFGLENDDPHSSFTRTLRLNQVPDDVVKLILFPFSLKGAAETWLENEPPYSLNTAAGGNLMTRNTQDALTIIENKARVRTCRNKPQDSSSGGTSTQIDAITSLTKQVKALECHFASMRETYDQNQEAMVQLMQNQMGQMANFQERPLGELSSNTRTNPLAKLKVITSTNGLTLDGSFFPHSNFLVYQEKEQEPETIGSGGNCKL